MSSLGRAIEIAASAHLSQGDKDGEHYILHPIRAMLRMSTREERIVAVLDDVAENSDWTLEALAKEGFSAEVVKALEAR